MQPTCQPTADNFMELLVMVDALKRASAARVTTVIPYFGTPGRIVGNARRGCRSPPKWRPR